MAKTIHFLLPLFITLLVGAPLPSSATTAITAIQRDQAAACQMCVTCDNPCDPITYPPPPPALPPPTVVPDCPPPPLPPTTNLPPPSQTTPAVPTFMYYSPPPPSSSSGGGGGGGGGGQYKPPPYNSIPGGQYSPPVLPYYPGYSYGPPLPSAAADRFNTAVAVLLLSVFALFLLEH